VKKLYDALLKVLRQPSTRESFARLGAEVLESTPDQFDKLMQHETAKWSKVVRDSGVKIE
jgi:tripartite-type tricarboxylate transporter receptor subunit TctC